MKTKLVFLSMMLSIVSFAQIDENVKQSMEQELDFNLRKNAKFDSRANAMSFLNSVSRNVDSDFKELLDSYIMQLSSKAIIIMIHPLNTANEELDKQVEWIVLHKENGKETGYLLDEKNVLFVLVGNSQQGISAAKFDIKKEKSLFRTSFDEVLALQKLIQTQAGIAAAKPAKIKIRLVELNPTKMKAPCLINVEYPNQQKEISFKIHEKSNFSFQVGVGFNKLSRKNVSISNNQLVVELDSAKKEEWKSNLNVFLTWHPGRDVDRFGPVWKQDLEERGLSKKAFEYWTIRRFGIYTGLKLSKDPMENLHLGLNYAVTNDFFINVGAIWTSTLQEGANEIGNVTSLNGAIDYIRRDYERDFYIGFSFMPSSVGKILGLSKEDE